MSPNPPTPPTLRHLRLQPCAPVDNSIEIVDNPVDSLLRNSSARGKTHWWTHYPHRTVENPEDRLEDSTANC